jgi:PTH1 family peptidyl-tRNA hydrolase
MSIRLIAGLGNPGREYADTRHNIGFRVIDAHVAACAARWEYRRDFDADLARMAASGRRPEHYALKPRTFMNASGESLGPFCRFHRIAPEEVVVIYDEMNLAFGRMKLTITGSAGGHNGAASVLQHLGDGFRRLRIGVGPREPSPIDLKDYVLGRLSSEQEQIFQNQLPEFLAALDLLLTQDVATAMNRLNRRTRADHDGSNNATATL